MAFLQIGPKPLTGVNNAVFNYQLAFTSADFSNALGGYAFIPEDFSLSVVFHNSQEQTVFIGIELNTPRGAITIGDRDTIGHVPPLSTGYFSWASTPQLAHIADQVTSVVIKIYFLFKENITVNQSSYALLRIDIPQDNLGPQPYIGRDFRAIEPGSNVCVPGEDVIAGNTSDFLLSSLFTTPQPLRYHIRHITLFAYPTPYPGDIKVYAKSVDAAGNNYVLAQLRSVTNEFICTSFPIDYYLDSDETIAIYGDNENTTNAYRAGGNIVGDYVL